MKVTKQNISFIICSINTNNYVSMSNTCICKHSVLLMCYSTCYYSYSQWNSRGGKCRIPETPGDCGGWPWRQSDDGLRRRLVFYVHDSECCTGGPQTVHHDDTCPWGSGGQGQPILVVRIWERDHLRQTTGPSCRVMRESKMFGCCSITQSCRSY